MVDASGEFLGATPENHLIIYVATLAGIPAKLPRAAIATSSKASVRTSSPGLWRRWSGAGNKNARGSAFTTLRIPRGSSATAFATNRTTRKSCTSMPARTTNVIAKSSPRRHFGVTFAHASFVLNRDSFHLHVPHSESPGVAPLPHTTTDRLPEAQKRASRGQRSVFHGRFALHFLPPLRTNSAGACSARVGDGHAAPRQPGINPRMEIWTT